MQNELLEYINYLCKRYNTISEEKAYNEAGMIIEYSRKHSDDKLKEMAFTISNLCDIAGIPIRKTKFVEGHKVSHDEEYNVCYKVFDV